MGTLETVIVKRQQRSVQIGANRCNLGHRSAVSALVERRVALTLRLVDLEAEYAATVEQIQALDAELERARQLSGWREPC